MWGRGTAVLLGLASLGSVVLLVGTTVPGFSWLIVPIFALTLLLAEGIRRTSTRVRVLIPALAFLSLCIAAASILTGRLNGLSDEPYSTPAYASLGLSMYSTPVSFQYVQYGVTHYEMSYDVYLPVLTFVQLPGVDYRWVALAGWGGIVYLIRRDSFASGGLVAPWIAVLAANGQNDFVPLLALTAAVVIPTARGGWIAETVALGLKQFANLLLFFYHLARREFLRAAAAVAVTAAILLPFLLVDPGGVWCHVVVGDPGTACHGHPWTFFVFKRNYWLYPAWVVLVFHSQIRARVRALGIRLKGEISGIRQRGGRLKFVERTRSAPPPTDAPRTKGRSSP